MALPIRRRRAPSSAEPRTRNPEFPQFRRSAILRVAVLTLLGSVALLAAAGAASVPDAQLESGDSVLELGQSLANAGHANGDGYADVIAGGHIIGGGTIFARAAAVFHGGPSGLGSTASTLADTRIESASVLARFGSAFSGRRLRASDRGPLARSDSLRRSRRTSQAWDHVSLPAVQPDQSSRRIGPESPA